MLAYTVGPEDKDPSRLLISNRRTAQIEIYLLIIGSKSWTLWSIPEREIAEIIVNSTFAILPAVPVSILVMPYSKLSDDLELLLRKEEVLLLPLYHYLKNENQSDEHNLRDENSWEE